jgi:SAM-dependent methyltransferase
MLDPFAIARPFASRFAFRLRRLRAKHTRKGIHVGDVDPATVAPDLAVNFQCNLCGAHNSAALAQLSREAPSCSACRSNVRFRALVRLIVRELLGRDLALPEMPKRRDIAGLGLSDRAAYALSLADKFSYENTWYHAAPRLDIANVSPERFGRYDFLIASDVFEHVVPPVTRAFDNARKLLKPGGKFFFTAPFTLEPDTVEHFPDLHDWTMAECDGTWRLTNTTVAGQRQTFNDLIFHGGPGSTLEMRLFSRAGLEREFARAGFARVRIAAEPYLPFGIHWPKPFSVPMVAYAS